MTAVAQAWWAVAPPTRTSVEVVLPQAGTLTLTDVLEGVVSVSVVAVDAAGNAGATPAAITFVSAPRPPALQFVVAPPAITASSTITLIASTDLDPFLFAGVRVTCAPEPCPTLLWVNATSRFGSVAQVQTVELPALPSATYTVSLTGVDILGREGPALTTSVVVDVTPPVGFFAVPFRTYVGTSSVTVVASAEDEHTPVGLVARVRLDGGAWVDVPPVAGEHTFEGVVDGEHVVEVGARDGAGNLQTDASIVLVSFLVDTVRRCFLVTVIVVMGVCWFACLFVFVCVC
jgi:hypothetical protein